MPIKCKRCLKVLEEKFFKKIESEMYSNCENCRIKNRNNYEKTKISFLKNFSELKQEWDFERNNALGLYPWNLSKGSNKKVWWKCKSGNMCHVWQAFINHRTKKSPRGCPYCSNKKICSCGCNSLWFSNPELREEWIEEKNESMKNYAPGSNKKVWWKCKNGSKCHVWETSISHRTGKLETGCPYCSNQKICSCGCNSLWFSNPELKEEWIEEKNGNMKNYSPSSHKKVWWKCKNGSKCHIWEAVIGSRTGKSVPGCPYCSNQKICSCGCNSLWFSNPELKEEWIEEKNGSMKNYAPSSGKKVWWKCKSEKKCHVWRATISDRTGKSATGCPYCSNQKICSCSCNSLWFSNPELRKEWIEEKNGSMKTYAPSSHKKVWWKCKNGSKCHIWEAVIGDRTKKSPRGCPYCSNKKICSCGCNSLWFSNPELREEWIEEKNESMKNYAPSSNKKVWWKCKSKKEGHKWETRISHRTKKSATGCSYCYSSKLEKETEEYFTKNKINYKSQYKTETCKNIKPLPFDFRIDYKEFKIRVELQGIQHFDSLSYYNKKSNKSIETILQTDLKKCISTYSDKESYIAISHLCINNIESILDNYLRALENNSNNLLFRFQINPKLYLDFNTSLSFSNDNQTLIQSLTDDTDDELLVIHQSYKLKIEALKNQNPHINSTFIPCNLCERSYISSLIRTHYHTEQHNNSKQEKLFELEEKYDNLFSITEDGIPILIIEDDKDE